MHPVNENSGDSGSIAFLIGQHKLADGKTVLEVEGDLDLASAPDLKWALADLQEAGEKNLIVDLGGVSFIDSTALGVLVGAQRGLDVGARLLLICSEPNVLRIFELTGLDGMFDIFGTLDEALAFAHGGAAAAHR
ncbi:MAG TPA: STAS domain-containing protein [Solirubrobacteraceae bacterium]|jgi:anti-sigma B factor antagonist